jgi:PAS domain S-box-containing protein
MHTSDDVLYAAFDQAAVGMALRDLQGNWLRVNQKLCDLLGYTAQEFLALTVPDITPAGERREASGFNERMREGEAAPYSREKRYLRKDGTFLEATVTISVVRDAQAKRNLLLAVIQDIGDRKAAELELARYRENLEELVRARTLEFEQAKEAAEFANHSKTVFLSNISHELRTPLNAILGFTQLMRDDTEQPLHPTHRDWMEQVFNSGEHLLSLIEGMLDLSKIDAGHLEMKRDRVAVGECVQTAMDAVSAQARARGIVLDPATMEPDVDCVLADRERLQQVLTNLLSNAVKYNHPQGRVRVRAQRQAGNRIVISVSDTGVGMSAEQCQVLFTPFTRHVPQGRVIEGAGIGLALTKSLVEFMGGTITVESTPGAGSTFSVSLLTSDHRTDATAR